MRLTDLFETSYRVYHGTDSDFANFDSRQIKQGLGEAPIANLKYIDRSEEEIQFPNENTPTVRGNSFDDADRRALTNPKWRAKVIHVFRKTPAPINVYAINAKWITLNAKDRRHSPADLSGLNSFSGSYDDMKFVDTFKFLPPNWQNSINFIILQNEGDERLPLTGWMLAHRFIHAVLNSQTRFPNQGIAYRGYFLRAWDRIMNAFHLVEDDVGFAASNLYAKLATFKSARNHQIPERRGGEFFIELMTQYMLKGDFDFNIDGVVKDEITITKIKSLIQDSKELLDSGFNECVGKLIVF